MKRYSISAMATPMYPRTESFGAKPKTLRTGYVLGAPMGDLGWFTTLLMSMATGFAVFFAATFAGIISILFWNAAGHKADFTVSYRLIGLPAGLLAMGVALSYLGMLWVRRIMRKA